MDKNVKVLFFIQFSFVLLFPISILMGVHFPFWGVIPALAIASLMMVIRKPEKGLLRTSLILNNLSILLLPFFFTLIILMAFPSPYYP